MAAYTTIDDPTAYFKVQLYTGTGSSNAITFDDTDTDMQPDVVWIKVRSEVNNHELYDSVRGATKRLIPDLTSVEDTNTAGLTAFGSDGFTVNTSHATNKSSGTFVAWCWKESATAGFDIVSFTGNGTDDRDISHSLSAVPHFMVTRSRVDVEAWVTYHHKNTSAPETDFLLLNDNQATTDNATIWSDEAPTSSVFTVGADNSTNGNTDAIITYLWSEKQGFSRFGSYTGNGNADGPFVYLGFRPAWLMVKHTGATQGWEIWDNKRSSYNAGGELLAANSSAAERSNSTWASLDFLSNGFKIRYNDALNNSSGSTYIYMAFAEAPFVNSEGEPCNAR